MVWKRRKIHGVGYNDVGDFNRHERAYDCWKEMLRRCYNEEHLKRHPTYRGCSVCEEWHYYSNFRKWFNENYPPKTGAELDKDILVKGNKVYSPQTCCFVPHRINTLLEKNTAQRNPDLAIGVYWDERTGKYCSSIKVNKTCRHLGWYNTKEEAFLAYKRVKEAYIILEASIAFSYGNINERTYKALCNYQVEKTD